MRKSFLFTSESVSEGHPDKVCDSISDALLDLFLSHDPYARAAVETMATTRHLVRRSPPARRCRKRGNGKDHPRLHS